MVFPPVQTSTASNDATCTSATIAPEPYSASIPSTATYQIASLANDYKSSNTATSLTAAGSSSLVTATCHSGISIDQNGVSANCHTCSGDKVVGGEGTYLAGAITAAQATLAANSLPGVQNVIIVLSDGGAGNAANLWSSTTTQATAPGSTILTMALTVPADVIPGTSVADNTAPCPTGTSNCAIPAGTQVLSTSGSAVTLTSRCHRGRHGHHKREHAARQRHSAFCGGAGRGDDRHGRQRSNQLLCDRRLHHGGVKDRNYSNTCECSHRHHRRHGHYKRCHDSWSNYFVFRVGAGDDKGRHGCHRYHQCLSDPVWHHGAVQQRDHGNPL